MDSVIKKEHDGIPVVSENIPYANGRFKDTIKKYNLPISTEKPDRFFAGEALIFRTDGAICTTGEKRQDRGRCEWKKIGDAFGKEEPRFDIGEICRLCKGKGLTD
jgi:hypothetical protein